MNNNAISQKESNITIIWRILQSVFLIIGFTILFFLFYNESIGKLLLWNFLITIAPLLFVLAPGLWRNVCPIGFISFIPHNLNMSRNRKISTETQEKLFFLSILLLLILVPLRHLFTSGLEIGLFILILTIIAFVSGLLFENKSAFCNSLCPIYPVEKLYGTHPLLSFENAHCESCNKCSVDCSDKVDSLPSPKIAKYKKFMIGGFPGFVFGWFQVADVTIFNLENLTEIFAFPVAAMIISYILYFIFSKILKGKQVRLLNSIFVASAVSCYYWYRLPAMLGYYKFSAGEVFYDFSSVLPEFTPIILRVIVILFFAYWFLFRKSAKLSWLRTPSL